MRHLSRVSAHGHSTGMTPKNLAIVWAPNLVRSKELEVGGVAALQVGPRREREVHLAPVEVARSFTYSRYAQLYRRQCTR